MHLFEENHLIDLNLSNSALLGGMLEEEKMELQRD